ncbi:MAG TPA: SAM-dependent chlorinase/fluorinase [Candidatus Limnocylindrales bacterium]|nr:SAM-dependent chlorinase/fluorinase [Candidatus Limnocylindrales bacterium]
MARRFMRPITTPAASRIPQDGRRPFVSLTSDWGVRDPSPAICRAVALGIAPDALIVDITHEVQKYNIRHGALMLWCALPFMPVGAHVCVVDPGVGTARRPLAIETARGDYLIGPDNGVLLPGAERLGGVVRVHRIENAQYRLPVVTSTFHGRDLFTPAAAHLAVGVPLDSIGPAIDSASLTPLDSWPEAVIEDGELTATLLYIDTFGNIKLGALAGQLAEALPGLQHGETVSLRVEHSKGREMQMPWAQTFGQVSKGDQLLYEDSYGRLCIAENQGDAAQTLKLEEGVTLRITRASAQAAE